LVGQDDVVKVAWIFLAWGFVCAAVVCAQDQEPGFLERITAAPDMERANALASKPFIETGGPDVQSARGYDRKASGFREFATAPAREMKSFLGIRNPWFGRKTAHTSSARIAEKTPLAEKVFPAGKAPADDRSTYRQASESAAGPEEQVATRPHKLRGTTQGALDLVSEGMKRELTIDEVREILNKNR
jgi:hypothetical protein